MSLLIGDGLVVGMHYKLTDNDGKVLDSTNGGDPFAYLHGANNIIPGLEKELTGKVVGDRVQVCIDPENGYGEVVDELIQTVPRTAFDGVENLEVGMVFEAEGAQQSTHRVLITAIEGDAVTVDGNHPLAGLVLNFDVEIVEVREPTETELQHGHAH